MLRATNRINKLLSSPFNAFNDLKFAPRSLSSSFLTNDRTNFPVTNKAVGLKEKLSKPRSQIKGVELLRNPSLYKVSQAQKRLVPVERGWTLSGLSL